MPLVLAVPVVRPTKCSATQVHANTGFLSEEDEDGNDKDADDADSKEDEDADDKDEDDAVSKEDEDASDNADDEDGEDKDGEETAK